jgi:predicted O-methyltransferase YrrM
MIYRSNLSAPDLLSYFKHTISRPMPHSMGHDVISDFADKADDDSVFGIFKQCGFWTHDEAAILYNVAKSIGGLWLDIGGLTGWTAAHLAAAGCSVVSVDPMYKNYAFEERTLENLLSAGCCLRVGLWPGTSDEFFLAYDKSFDGIVIDGDHVAPQPLSDAINAVERVTGCGVILVHDATHKAAQDGYHYLAEQGWTIKLYHTPHVVALCYRGGFVPPKHVPDPRICL